MMNKVLDSMMMVGRLRVDGRPLDVLAWRIPVALYTFRPHLAQEASDWNEGGEVRQQCLRTYRA